MRPSIFLAIASFAASITAAAHPKRPKALVWRGGYVCGGCPAAVKNLLTSSPSHFDVSFVGPNETVHLTPEALSKVDIFAYPGGPDAARAAKNMAPYNETVRNFVANGGKYLGFCLGGYLAGLPGFGLLPQGDNTYAEIAQPGAQVKTGKNTIIQVDWTFHTGKLAGQTKEQWMFFQDGGTIKGSNTTNLEVLGRFASNQNIAAAVSPFGKGWVGVTGPHPEADQSWYTPYHLKNPDGINFTIGWDFIETVYGKPKGDAPAWT